MFEKPRCSAVACVALAMATLLYPASLFAQPSGSPVVVDEARLESVQQYREVVGELRALRRALLAAEEEGIVVEFDHREGDAVKAGDVVARLRDARAEMEVRREQADLAARRAVVAERTADLQRARRDLVRIDELQLRGSAAKTELEDRRTAVSVAEARLAHADAEVAAAEAALELAADHLQRRTVLAPLDGFVVSRRTELGQWVRQGDPVLELVALDELEARVRVPESLISNVQLSGSADPVRLRILASGQIISAPVDGIIPDADPLSRLIPIRMRLDNRDHTLRPGMSIVGLIPTGSREPSLTVHKDAILRDDAGEFVFFDAGGVAAVARIHTVLPLGERVAIRSSTLRPGMAVVTEGNERLNPGQPLSILPRSTRPEAGVEAATSIPSEPGGNGSPTPEERGR